MYFQIKNGSIVDFRAFEANMALSNIISFNVTCANCRTHRKI